MSLSSNQNLVCSREKVAIDVTGVCSGDSHNAGHTALNANIMCSVISTFPTVFIVNRHRNCYQVCCMS